MFTLSKMACSLPSFYVSHTATLRASRKRQRPIAINAAASESASRPLPFREFIQRISLDVDHWRSTLRGISGLKVGLAWAGGLRNGLGTRRTGKKRDIPIDALAPLAGIPGVTFISLQKRDGSSTALPTAVVEGILMFDTTSMLNDFADTAALIQNLDLIVSADTAVAHLAGALGKPVWFLSRYEGEWRWLPPHTDSPWYPTMRIFWQQQPGDWSDPMARVASELWKMAHCH